MKKLLLAILVLTTVFTSVSAADKVLEASRLCLESGSFWTRFCEKIGGSSADNRPEQMFLTEQQTILETISFNIVCSEDGIEFKMKLQESSGKSPSGELELFFQPDTLKGISEYYQFFVPVSSVFKAETAKGTPVPQVYLDTLANLGMPSLPSRSSMEILPYYYAHTTNSFPYLRHYRIDVTTDAQEPSKAMVLNVRIFIPWSDLAVTRPFDENGKGGLWRFTLIRSSGAAFVSWQGNHHRSQTWGLLKLPDISASAAKRIYRRAALETCSRPPWLESFLFDRKTLARGKESLTNELTELRGKIPADADSLSVDEWVNLIQDLRAVASGRRFITSGPDPFNKKWSDPAWKMEESNEKETSLVYTFRQDFKNVWLVNFSAQGNGRLRLSPVTVAVDGVAMPQTARNWHFGHVKKGATLKITVQNGKNKKIPWCRFNFTVEDFGLGLEPCGPTDFFFPNPLESLPVQGCDGRIHAPHLSRHLPQCVSLLIHRPQVVWFGESMLDGLGFTEPFRKFHQAYPSEECGVVADNPKKVLWRLENGVFALVKPEYVVLSFDSRPTVDEDTQTIEKIIDLLHKQTPSTKILIISELPSRRDLKYSPDLPFVKMNARLKAMAEKRDYLRYLDVTAGFYDVDGNLKMDHYQNVYFTVPVYQTWCDAVRRTIDADQKTK